VAAASSAIVPRGKVHSIPIDDEYYAINPTTQEPVSHEMLHQMISEFATKKGYTFEEVMEWIQQMEPSNDQDIVDLLYAQVDVEW